MSHDKLYPDYRDLVWNGLDRCQKMGGVKLIKQGFSILFCT